MINLFGYNLYAHFLVNNKKILAYSLHFDKEKSYEHLIKIKRFHKLRGKITSNEKLDKKLEKLLYKKIEEDIKIKFDLSKYRNKEIYEFLLKIHKGKVSTYSEISKSVKKSIGEIIITLARNPFLILIPCHRVIKKNGDISGYTPLGKEFKRIILLKEGFLK